MVEFFFKSIETDSKKKERVIPVRLIVYCRWRTMNDLKIRRKKKRKKRTGFAVSKCAMQCESTRIFVLHVWNDNVSNTYQSKIFFTFTSAENNLLGRNISRIPSISERETWIASGQMILAWACSEFKQVKQRQTEKKTQILFIKVCMRLCWSYAAAIYYCQTWMNRLCFPFAL